MSDNQQPDEGHHLVVVHRAKNDGDAQVVLALLRANGIDAYEESSLPHSVYPVVGDGQIRVHEGDADEARRLLTARPSEEDTQNLADEGA